MKVEPVKIPRFKNMCVSFRKGLPIEFFQCLEVFFFRERGRFIGAVELSGLAKPEEILQPSSFSSCRSSPSVGRSDLSWVFFSRADDVTCHFLPSSALDSALLPPPTCAARFPPSPSSPPSRRKEGEKIATTKGRTRIRWRKIGFDPHLLSERTEVSNVRSSLWRFQRALARTARRRKRFKRSLFGAVHSLRILRSAADGLVSFVFIENYTTSTSTTRLYLDWWSSMK